MRQKSGPPTSESEHIVKDIRRAARKHHAAEEKIRIVLDSLRGVSSIAELCRPEGIAESRYHSSSKEFLEAGKRRLAGDTARAATSSEVKDLRKENRDLKEVVAEQALTLTKFLANSSGTATLANRGPAPLKSDPPRSMALRPDGGLRDGKEETQSGRDRHQDSTG